MQAPSTSIFSWPYIHLLINHFPVVLSVVGLTAVIAALIFRRRGLWLYAMGTLTAAGLLVYPVRFSGKEADEVLHDPWYIAQGVIEEHDDASTYALIFLLLAGAIAAYGLWRTLERPEEPIPGWLKAGVFIGALAGCGTVAYTAYLGGKIIHEAPILQLPTPPANLPPGIAAPPPPPSPSSEAAEGKAP
jgi:uncharacterized membrane protein